MENFGEVAQAFLNPNGQEVDINHFIEPADTPIGQAIPNLNLEEVDINQYNPPAFPLMDDGLPADVDIFSEIPALLEADFPSLEMVNEVIGGDVRNLDEFKDTVLAGIVDSGVEVQSAVPSDDEAILHTSDQPLGNIAEFNFDVPKVTPLTPVVLLLDGQIFLNNSGQLQMHQPNGMYTIAPQQNGAHSIAPQEVQQLITLPAQYAVPSPLVAVNENAAGDTATAVGPSHTPSPGSSKRKRTEESEGATNSKKQKLYQAEAFADPEMEKKRLNAINAKNHRDRTKLAIKVLEQKVAGVSQDRDNIAQERDGYIMEIQELRKQNEELRKQTEDFKKKFQKAMQVLEMIQQQRKCGVPQADILDILHQ